jgi:peptidyl-prolyl cis-trans isomerase A (cyclophilin A)
MNSRRFILPSFIALILLGCSSSPPEQKKAAAPAEPEAPEQVVNVKFETSKGDFVLEVHPKWAPLGAERFLELVKDGYYDNARFFRIVPNFVIQWGLAANPAMTKKWDKPIKDDYVLHTNSLGTVSFAKSDVETRTTQVFVNIRSNQILDDDGFAPFGRVTEGMEVFDKIYRGYGGQPDQDQIKKRGNAYLAEKYPNLDYIKKAYVP